MVCLLRTFKPVNKLRSRLVHVKDKTPRDKQSNLLYGFKSNGPNFDEAHVGETKQSLKARFSKHKHPCSSEHQADSAIYIVILGREEQWFERGVREAIQERVEKLNLNKRGACISNYHMLGTNHWSIFFTNCHITSQQLQPIRTNLSLALQMPEEVQWDWIKICK